MKLEKLREILLKMERVLLAYSGGVDSTFLLKVASDVLGANVLAVTAVSSTYPEEEYRRACEIAQSMGVRHITIKTEEMGDPNFHSNPPERCYFCKKELFRKMQEIADRESITFILDATNADDRSDYRPGRTAAKEAGVRSPLTEIGMTKDEIRTFSRKMDLPTWNRPAEACLASRFPYGESITPDRLKQVERAERFLRRLGFEQVRVRFHNNLARIEVDPLRVHELLDAEQRKMILIEMKRLGFVYVTVDLEGYRTGSMNEVLEGIEASGEKTE